MNRAVKAALCAAASCALAPAANAALVAFNFNPGAEATAFSPGVMPLDYTFHTGPFSVLFNRQYTEVHSSKDGLYIGSESPGPKFSLINGATFDLASVVLLGNSSSSGFNVRYVTSSGDDKIISIITPTLGETRIYNLDLVNIRSFQIGSYAGTTTVTRFVGVQVVPEPATWALMLVGFGLVGYAMRRRRVAFA